MSRRYLFLSPYPTSVASHRVRLEQYVPYLERDGATVDVRSLVGERAYRARGPALAAAVLAGSLLRIADALRAQEYDAVLVHREALPLPTAAIEGVLSRTSRRLIFDFDDAIYLPQPFARSAGSRWLRSPAKFGRMVGAAHIVFAGNQHLAERAAQHARDVRVVPTTVDTDRVTPGPVRDAARITIGWMGSPSTAHYLDLIAPALREVLRREPRVDIRIVGAGPRPGLTERTQTVSWSLETEVDELRSFDIGLMPLPDDEWSRGKCGYKSLQYMSAGVHAVGSPVGVATEMIEHGRNGLLAKTPQDWVAALLDLAADPARRRILAQAGRHTAVERYSLAIWAPRFSAMLSGAL